MAKQGKPKGELVSSPVPWISDYARAYERHLTFLRFAYSALESGNHKRAKDFLLHSQKTLDVLFWELDLANLLETNPAEGKGNNA